jgi:hypothetical protein
VKLSNTFPSIAMATAKPCLAQLSRTCLYSMRQPTVQIPLRTFSTTAPRPAKLSRKKLAKKEAITARKNAKIKGAPPKKKKTNINWLEPDLRGEEQFSLLEAMRYVLVFIVKELC